jgi:hypothetical protein
MAGEEYKVEGYGKNPEYDGPYLDGSDFDPNFVYAKAGDPEAQEKWQNDLKALAGEVDEDADSGDSEEDKASETATSSTTSTSSISSVKKD